MSILSNIIAISDLDIYHSNPYINVHSAEDEIKYREHLNHFLAYCIYTVY